MNSFSLLMPAYLNVVPATFLQLTIGGMDIGLEFRPALAERAATPSGMDRWAVAIRSVLPASAPVLFIHATPAAAEPVEPSPIAVLARVASDISLAMAMPNAAGVALDWLFTEGYVTWPSEAVTMHRDLSAALASAEVLLAGRRISLLDFAAHVGALPLALPPCPYMGRKFA